MVVTYDEGRDEARLMCWVLLNANTRECIANFTYIFNYMIIYRFRYLLQ